MKYLIYKSIPLEEDYPGIGERSFDIFGNFVEVDAFGEPHILVQSVLDDGEKVDEYENEIFLNGFWSQTKLKLEWNDIYLTSK